MGAAGDIDSACGAKRLAAYRVVMVLDVCFISVIKFLLYSRLACFSLILGLSFIGWMGVGRC
jgi:hypothetical protein